MGLAAAGMYNIFMSLSVCLSISSVYLSICLSVYLSVCLSVYLSVCLSPFYRDFLPLLRLPCALAGSARVLVPRSSAATPSTT